MIWKTISIIILVSIAFTATTVSQEDAISELKLPDSLITVYVTDGSDSWFEMTLSEVPEGYDIKNGKYPGWCTQKNVFMSKHVEHAIHLFSSYDSSMPEKYKSESWDKINYVINHRNNIDHDSVSKVIWYFLDNYPYPSSDAEARALISDTEENGEGFIPQEGDHIAIVMDSVQDIQNTFLELEVPAPHQSDPEPQTDPIDEEDEENATPVNPVNHKPTADGTAGEPYHGFVGEKIIFNASRSYDRDGSIVSWEWDFGDGNSGSGKVVPYIYTDEGKYSVILNVTDDKGGMNSYNTTALITLSNYPPSDPILYGQTQGTINNSYTFTALSIDPDSDPVKYIFYWGDGEITITEYIQSKTVVTQSHKWLKPGEYTISVKAMDNETESKSKSMTVNILEDVEYETNYSAATNVRTNLINFSPLMIAFILALVILGCLLIIFRSISKKN